jgi:hypothetical protein
VRHENGIRMANPVREHNQTGIKCSIHASACVLWRCRRSAMRVPAAQVSRAIQRAPERYGSRAGQRSMTVALVTFGRRPPKAIHQGTAGFFKMKVSGPKKKPPGGGSNLIAGYAATNAGFDLRR